jgi:hypothetical protein
MYCSLFVDQSVVLNRRRDGPVGDMTIEELEDEKRDEELAAFYIQVLISSTFYARVFCSKVLFSTYVLAKKVLSYKKCEQKMLMKLTLAGDN